MKNKMSFIHLFIILLLGLTLSSPILSVTASAVPDLQVTNLSGSSFDFTYDQLLAMPQVTTVAALYCYGNLVTSGGWTGVSLSYLLSQAKMTPEVGSVEFTASDGYHVSIPIDLALQPQVILAYQKDSQPLSEGLRLVLPEYNGAAWIAMITSITMSTTGADYPASVGVAGIKIPVEIPTQSKLTQQSPSNPQAEPLVPSASQNQSSVQTAAPPTNVSEPNQATPAIHASSPENPLVTIALPIAFVLIVVSLAATYVTVKRRKTTSRR